MSQTLSLRSTSRILILAGVLSFPIGLVTLFYPPAGDPELWGYPFDHTASVVVSVFLVVCHLLKAWGFAGLTKLNGSRLISWSLWLAVLGFVAVAACEGVSAAMYGVPMDDPAAVNLNNAYGAASMLFAIPSMIAGIPIARKRLLAGFGRWSVFASGAFMVFVVTPALIMGRAWPAYLALTLWSLFYLWIGVAVKKTIQNGE